MPNDANADVSIDDGKTGINSVVTMDNSYTAGRLTVDAGDTLNLANNVSFYLASSFAGSESIINNGTINVNGTTSFTDVRFVGSQSLTGNGGTLNLNGANDRVFANNGNGDRLTIGFGATIQGTGNLGVGQSTFTNNGQINANINGATLTIQPGGGSGDFTTGSTGTTIAELGGKLVLTGGSFTNNGPYRGHYLPHRWVIQHHGGRGPPDELLGQHADRRKILRHQFEHLKYRHPLVRRRHDHDQRGGGRPGRS